MRVFISWSGDLSRRIAETLRKYLPLMIQGMDVFMSKHDLESGSRWSSELAKELEESSFGILCLTPDNLDSPWVLFEAGALTKHIEGRACGVLIGAIKPTDVSGPLAQFQNRVFSREEVQALLHDINAKLPKPLQPPQIEMILEKWWPDLEREYETALKKSTGEARRRPRDQQDLLEEILTRIRSIERTLDLSETRTVQDALDQRWKRLTEHEKQILRELAQAQANGAPIPLERFSQQDVDSLLQMGWVIHTPEGIGLPHQVIQEYILQRYGVAR